MREAPRHMRAADLVRARIVGERIGPGGEVPFASELARLTGVPLESLEGALRLMVRAGELVPGGTSRHRLRVARPVQSPTAARGRGDRGSPAPVPS